jgi:membrane-associated phospholipid phosphatase
VGSQTVGRARAGEERAAGSRVPWPGARSLTLVALFVLLAVTVEQGWWGDLDRTVDDWASAHRVQPVWDAAKTVFDVATPQIVLPVTLALAVLVAWRRQRWDIAVDGAVRLGLVIVSVLVLKPLLAVPDPRDVLGTHGGAFPSGHTTTALVCVTLVLGWLGRPSSVTGQVVVVGLVVGAVGATVVYLHYHSSSDVVGGIVLGLLIATLPLPRWLRRPQDPAVRER